MRMRGGANAESGIDLDVEIDGGEGGYSIRTMVSWNMGTKAVREFLGR